MTGGILDGNLETEVRAAAREVAVQESSGLREVRVANGLGAARRYLCDAR